ncbi:hypothetical protein [Natronobacterium texcoconense]|uniref:Uncharacterized protein n=1 Tax=Natronobacterium texcoconense TaxID=1095778 RepID=A0A1H1GQS4_NATTX|nr:hypothetical protein [Natronobacterium texcoconense]SDR15491.1 hypothetical protein SAMN04489842_2551 [Natronobacterium texcoconense]
MAEKGSDERRERASGYNIRTITYKPSHLSAELREAGLTVALLTIAAGLIFIVDRMFTLGIGTVLVGIAIAALSGFAKMPGGERRKMHILNGDDETLRFELEIRDTERDKQRVRHEYDLPAGACAVYPDAYRPDAEYTVTVSLENGKQLRTITTPVRSTAIDAADEFVIEVTRDAVRSRESATVVDDESVEQSPHELSSYSERIPPFTAGVNRVTQLREPPLDSRLDIPR